MWHKKNADPSAYRKGVCHAHRNISAWSSLNHWNKKTRMDMAAKLHDEADKDQYEIRASKGGKASDFARGQAMEYGMYAHTGKHLK